jgi:biotin carboxyl carrier protein
MERELIANGTGVRSYDGRESPGARARLSTTELVRLIALMKEHSELQEITIEHQAVGLKLTLRKPEPVTHPSRANSHALAAEFEELNVGHEALDGAPEDEAVAAPSRGVTVSAPLVGIYRTSAKGDDQPLLAPGAAVRQGQILGAIESLNVLNEVEAAVGGTVQEVVVEAGQRVEYGQPLFVIEPAS